MLARELAADCFGDPQNARIDGFTAEAAVVIGLLSHVIFLTRFFLVCHDDDFPVQLVPSPFGRRRLLDRSGTADRTAPVLSHCSPDRCPNSCITDRHLGPWEASIAEAEILLKDKRLSPLQRRALADDNARKRRLIAPLVTEQPA